jgi:hypothetical protein
VIHSLDFVIFRNYHLNTPGQSTFTVDYAGAQREPAPFGSLPLKPLTFLGNRIVNENGKYKVTTDYNTFATYQLESERLPVTPGELLRVPYEVTVEPGGQIALGLLNTKRDLWYEEHVLGPGRHEGILETTVPFGETETSLVFRNYHLNAPGQSSFTIDYVHIDRAPALFSPERLMSLASLMSPPPSKVVFMPLPKAPPLFASPPGLSRFELTPTGQITGNLRISNVYSVTIGGKLHLTSKEYIVETNQYLQQPGSYIAAHTFALQAEASHIRGENHFFDAMIKSPYLSIFHGGSIHAEGETYLEAEANYQNAGSMVSDKTLKAKLGNVYVLGDTHGKEKTLLDIPYLPPLSEMSNSTHPLLTQSKNLHLTTHQDVCLDQPLNFTYDFTLKAPAIRLRDRINRTNDSRKSLTFITTERDLIVDEFFIGAREIYLNAARELKTCRSVFEASGGTIDATAILPLVQVKYSRVPFE